MAKHLLDPNPRFNGLRGFTGLITINGKSLATVAISNLDTSATTNTDTEGSL